MNPLIPADNSAFVNVTEIQGRLYIYNCSLSSIFSLFPKLKKVSTRKGIALNLENIERGFKVNDILNLELESRDHLALKLQGQEKV